MAKKKKITKPKFAAPKNDREVSLLKFCVQMVGDDDVLSVVRSRQIINMIEREYGVTVTMAEYQRPGIRGFTKMDRDKLRGRKV